MLVRSVSLVLMAAAAALALTSGPPQPADLEGCATALDRGEYANASRQAQAYVRLHPDAVQARILLARAFIGLNNAPAALDQLRAALRRDPKSLDALYYTSKLTGLLSQQEFAFVVEHAPDSARTHQIRAETMEAQGDAAGAEREYLAAIEQRPRTASLMNSLGDLMRHQKRYKDALPWYAKTLESDPGNYDALYGSGASYQLMEDSDKALPFYRKALAADPSSIAAKMALGEALLLTGHEKDAVPLLEEAARTDPNFRRLQFLLGRAYQLTGRAEDSRRAFERMRTLAGHEDEVETPVEAETPVKEPK